MTEILNEKTEQKAEFGVRGQGRGRKDGGIIIRERGDQLEKRDL